MRIDSSASADAVSKLADTGTEVAVAITKQVIDATDGAMLQLLSSLEPHLGQQVDISL